eukprot:273374_1
MIPHKSIVCNIKKLEKGQNIKLKNSSQFQNIKNLTIYIESNQKDTDNTFINGIIFKGKKIINKNEFESANSECPHIYRIRNAMIYYKNFDMNIMKFNFKEKYDSLLTDYVHIILHHNNTLKNINSKCDLSECKIAIRHHNANTTKEEHRCMQTKYDTFLLFKDMMDSCHCYLYHIHNSSINIDVQNINTVHKIIKTTSTAIRKLNQICNTKQVNKTENSGEEKICDYRIVVQRCAASELHGYYKCIGMKNDKYYFQQQNNGLVTLFCKNEYWYLMNNNICLYKSWEISDEPVSINWECINGLLPLPRVSKVEMNRIASSPMVLYKQEKQIDKIKRQNSKLVMDEYQVDVDMIEFCFNGENKMGFYLNITQKENSFMEITKIIVDGQAEKLGVFVGDILSHINDVDVSKNQDKTQRLLKLFVSNKEKFSVTFARRKVENLMIIVNRAGNTECNGKYTIECRDVNNSMCPMYVKKDVNYGIKMVYTNPKNNESLWCIINTTTEEHYYMSMTAQYLPPQCGWELIPNSTAKYPAPGLQFTST